MARPIQEGLEYFSLDVDFYDDPKILLIEEQFGVKGGYIANRLLCWIYRNGYYLKWDNNMALVFAKRVGHGMTGSLVSEVVNALVKCSFFDEGVFARSSILTSRGIQKRWMRVITDSRRRASINVSIDLVNVPDSVLMREETHSKRTESTQSKVKESKVKERDNSRTETSGPDIIQNQKPPPVAPPPSSYPKLDEVIRWFEVAGGTAEMAEKFWNKWESFGWEDNGKPLVRWAGAARNFIINYKQKEQLNGRQNYRESASGGQQSYGQSAGAIRLAHDLARDIGVTGPGGASDPGS